MVLFTPNRSMVYLLPIEPWFYLLTLHIEHYSEVGFPLVVLSLHGVGSAVGSFHSCDVQHGTLSNKTSLKTVVLIITSHSKYCQ